MKNLLFGLILFFLATGIISSQNKELTIDDVSYNLYVKSYNKNPASVAWRGATDKITYMKYSIIHQVDLKGKDEELIKASDISEIFEKTGMQKMAYMPGFQWLTDNEILIEHDGYYVVFDVVKKSIVRKMKQNEKAENADLDNNYTQFAYTVDNNLYFTNKEGKEIAITKDENKGIVNGKAVHRNEFGINEGIFWSPKSNFIAFYRMDETMVTDYPLVDVTQRIATVNNIKYPMAGMTSHQVTLGVYNIATGTTTFVKTGEPKEQYLTNIAWSPDEKSIYIAVLNREQNHMKFNQYNATTGDFVKTLFEEKNDKYIEPLVPMKFLKNSADKFIWQSQRDGYNHLYLYDVTGKLLKQLTKGNFVVKSIIDFDVTGNKIFIEHTDAKRAIETHISEVNITDGTMRQLTKTPGTHSAVFNKACTYFVDDFSSMDVYKELNLVSVKDGKSNKIIETTNVFADYNIRKPDVFTIKAADGKTDLYCAIAKPVNFDATKKYPVIIYVYGGPHAQMINDTWLGGIGYWDFYMAQKGYIVMTIDNRGSANRGLEFENVIHRNLGVNEMADQMKGIEYLKSQPWADMNRVGVHGWSFGGFMTTSLMVNYPEIFKVGAAGGPVIDWKYYEVMYGERYMDTPEENPEGYKNACLVDKAKNLKGKLLLIHGAVDPTVVWQNSLTFVQECINIGVQVDYFPYPLAEHNVRGPHRIHLMQKITQYFDDYLMPVK
jgi:dipeptidyl aminopeptidase/acylaminoacyl peptidase